MKNKALSFTSYLVCGFLSQQPKWTESILAPKKILLHLTCISCLSHKSGPEWYTTPEPGAHIGKMKAKCRQNISNRNSSQISIISIRTGASSNPHVVSTIHRTEFSSSWTINCGALPLNILIIHLKSLLSNGSYFLERGCWGKGRGCKRNVPCSTISIVVFKPLVTLTN